MVWLQRGSYCCKRSTNNSHDILANLPNFVSSICHDQVRPASHLKAREESNMESKGEAEGEERGERGGGGRTGGSWHAFAILQNHHPKPNPKTRIHLIGIVGKTYNELVSY